MTTAPFLPAHVRPADRERVEEQALRARLLGGMHRVDVEKAIEEALAPEIAADLVWAVDLSANPFKAIFTQLNVTYTTPPDVTVQEGSAYASPDPEEASAILTPSLWPLMQTRALYQMAVRECFVRLDWPTEAAISEGDPAEVSYRVVTPDYVHVCLPHPRHPDRPVMLKEYRQRTRTRVDPNTGEEVEVDVPTYDVWDVRNPAAPIFRIEEITTADGRSTTRDVTEEFDPGRAEAGYPYRDSDGRPIFPYILAHAQVQSCLWDYMEGVEIVQGTLRLAGGWTWWWDGFTNSANPQRVAIDLQFAGSRTETLSGAANVETIPVSPKSVLLATSKTDRGGQVASFPAAMDPKTGVESLRAYEERLAIFAGISPADIQTTTSAMSGAAISISREGKRAAQAAYQPAFRMADQLILATAARLANAYAGTSLPEDPRAWGVEYAPISESATERKARVETTQAEVTMGTLNRVGAVRRLTPTIETDEEAIRYIGEMAQQDALAVLAEQKARADLMAELSPSSPSDTAPDTSAEDAYASLEGAEEIISTLRERVTDADTLALLGDLEELVSDAADAIGGPQDAAEGEDEADAAEEDT